MGRFRKADRRQLKLRMGIDGPSGSGKTLTALRLARALGKRIALIETEHGAASKYVGDVIDGEPIDFDVQELASFSPSEYTSAIEDAGRDGYDVLIVDSLSHAWEGKDGALELVSKKDNSYTAWKDVTPMHRRMVEAILASPCHVIVTMRSKTEYVLEPNDKGKMVPRRVGMAPIQRPGMEYEFDLYCSMDWSHIMTVTKTRCLAVDGDIVVKPGAAWLQPVVEWLERGTRGEVKSPANRIADEQLQRIAGFLSQLGWPPVRIERELPKRFGCTALHQLNVEQARDFIKWLETQCKSLGKLVTPQPPTGQSAISQPAATEASTPSTVRPSPSLSSPQDSATPAGNADRSKIALSEVQLGRIKEHYAEWYSRRKFELERYGKSASEIKAALKDEWQAILSQFGVTSATLLSAAAADRLVNHLDHVLTTFDMEDDLKKRGDAAHDAASKNVNPAR